MHSAIAPAFRGVTAPMVAHCRSNGDDVDTLNAFDEAPFVAVYSRRERAPKFMRRMRRKQRYPKD